jgi:hypothetical protein
MQTEVMMDINIREIAKMSIEEVIDRFNECDETFNVEFDDGTLRHNGSEIVFTRFILNYWNELNIKGFITFIESVNNLFN